MPSHRQIPYAIGQFTVNEFCHELAFRSMSEETRRTLSPSSKFGISLGSGIIAGFAAAILSQVSGTLSRTCVCGRVQLSGLSLGGHDDTSIVTPYLPDT